VKAIERVMMTLQHQEPDRVPVYPFMSGISRSLVGASYPRWATDADVAAEAFIRVTDELDLDMICTLVDLSVEAADFGQKVIFPENEAPHPDHNNHLITQLEDYQRIEPINPRTSPRMSTHIRLCDRLVQAKGGEVAVVPFVFGPLGIVSMLRGQADFYMDMLDDPTAVKSALHAVTETLTAYCDALIETGVHAIMFATLFASQSIMSKAMWREFEGTFVRRLAQHVHQQGCMVMVHNCGNGPYFDAQIEAMEPEAVSFLHMADDCQSLAEMKARYGQMTTLMGCVSPTWIAQAQPEEVETECRRQIATLAKGGSFILATGCEYPANSPMGNAKVMVRAAKEYGRY
jgi:uroporphyrinogen decarboxylase